MKYQAHAHATGRRSLDMPASEYELAPRRHTYGSISLAMSDMFDRATRSRIMKNVRTAGTDPESRLARALLAIGLRFTTNDSRVFGKPDLVFRRAKLAVFVDGDFWHGRAWFERRAAPATNAEFWISKFERNRRRDRLVDRRLKRDGWIVLRFWASDVRCDPQRSASRVERRLRRLRLAASGRPDSPDRREASSRSRKPRP